MHQDQQLLRYFAENTSSAPDFAHVWTGEEAEIRYRGRTGGAEGQEAVKRSRLAERTESVEVN